MSDLIQHPPMRFRILIVDNSETERDSNKLVVDALGYCDSVPAMGEKRALLVNAITLARLRHCHLALVDMRLLDDFDPSDESGLELISDLAPMLSLIVSGSDESGKARVDPETLDKAGGVPGYIGYVRKTKEKLYPRIIASLQRYWNWNLKYDLSKMNLTAEQIFARLGLADLEHIPVDEVHHVLRRSYSRNESALDLESLEGPYDPSDPTSSLRRSVVFFAQPYDASGRPLRKEIIKIAPEDDIKREYDNYNDYVRHLQHQHTALIELPPVQSWEIGMIRYTDETQGQRKRFTEWYTENDSAKVKLAIQHLFREVFKPWYEFDEEARSRVKGNIFEYYTRADVFKKLGPRISAFTDSTEPLSIHPFFGNFIHPVRWARLQADKSTFISRWQAPVHGDLHSGNIIVGQDAKTYIIDYERTGRGFYLRDFVELEKDIRLRLLKLEGGHLDLALHLDCLLMAQESVDTLPPWGEPPAGSATETEVIELYKAFETICTVRQAAQEIGRLERMDEYYWALLMETLLSVTDPRIVGFSHQRALLSASLICERLERWRNYRKTWSSLDRCERVRQSSGFRSESSQSTPPVTNYALLIGVGDTPHDPPSALPTTVLDAETLKITLIDPSLCSYPGQNVHILSNETASLPRIRIGLQWLADQTTANPDSTAIVYFSGHGGHLQTDDRYFLVPSDINPTNIEGSVLWASEFTQRLRAIKAKRVLVLIDACHAAGMAAAKEASLLSAGGFVKAPPPEGLLKSWQQSQPTGSTKHAIPTPSQGEGRAIISSSRDDQSSYVRKDGTLSIFTHHLLEALRGKANRPGDISVTVSTLIGHLSKTVPDSAARDWGASQRPWAELVGEDFPVTSIGSGHKTSAISGSEVDPSTSSMANAIKSDPVTLFYSYSHKDEKLRDRLEKHLSILKRQGVISNWHDRRITAGDEWKGIIDEHLNSADIILLLVSADFLASDYCYDIEMKRALERHEAKAARVIPVILRPVDWNDAPFGKLQALPADGKPVMEWRTSDGGFQDVARGIRVVVKQYRSTIDTKP